MIMNATDSIYNVKARQQRTDSREVGGEKVALDSVYLGVSSMVYSALYSYLFPHLVYSLESQERAFLINVRRFDPAA